MSSSTLINRWDISPYVGVGPLRFGLTRSQVRSMLGGDVSTFKKGLCSSIQTDAYIRLGLHLHYNEDDWLECIEAFGLCPIFYKGVSLLNTNVQEVLKSLADLGLSSRYDDGYFLDGEGFVLDAPEGVVQAVTVYGKGYYDELD